MARTYAISPARRRADLEARWRETLERLTALSVAYHDTGAVGLVVLTPSAGSAAPPQQERRDDQDAWRLAQRVAAERQVLAEIEAALDRLARGRYGRCEQCRRRIPARLLATRPEARFCSSCSDRAARLPAYA
jgi:RNA polymerase-binding transcription factor DksA